MDMRPAGESYSWGLSPRWIQSEEPAAMSGNVDDGRAVLIEGLADSVEEGRNVEGMLGPGKRFCL